MDDKIREELANEAAASVHEEWIDNELQNFHARFLEALKKEPNSPQKALLEACFVEKNGKKVQRNEVEIDADWCRQNPVTAYNMLLDFKRFKNEMIKKGFVTVKRFTERVVTPEEQKRLGADYKEGKENILRPFSELSASSKQENLDAAVSAVTTYIMFAASGRDLLQHITDDGGFSETVTDEQKKTIGTLIHADWMQRNDVNDSNRYLFVEYDALDAYPKQQDLNVFKAVMQKVKQNLQRYAAKISKKITKVKAGKIEEEVLISKGVKQEHSNA